MKILILDDISDFLAVRKKTLTRIAIADIMPDEMLIEWYRKVLANKSRVDSLKGFGYFESEFSHGYIMSSRFYNYKALLVIEYHLELRGIEISKYRDIKNLKNKIYSKQNI